MGCKVNGVLTALAVFALVAGFSGCGHKGPTIIPVSGRVTLDGKPIEGATVMLIPKEGRPATGTTNTAGEFQMTTLEKNDGAVAGAHRVTVSLIKMPTGPMSYEVGDSPESAKLIQHIIPMRYENPETSGLTAEVKQGMAPLEFNLTK